VFEFFRKLSINGGVPTMKTAPSIRPRCIAHSLASFLCRYSATASSATY
jgi:hypothetical protein